MNNDFLHTTLGRTGLRVSRLGLSGTYRPGKEAIQHAIDQGVDYFFCYGFDSQTIGVVRDVIKTDRDRFVIATGAYNMPLRRPNLRRAMEKRLRQFHTDHIDVFLFLGATKEEHLSDDVLRELHRLRDDGKARAVGLSTHNRRLAGRLAAEGALDVIMMRYNAAHRGAETEIFPFRAAHNTGIISYTATRWRYLLRRPKPWPTERPIPTADMCYRFVLSNPSVDVCLNAPSNATQLKQNLRAIEKGPLSEDEMRFMREFGDVVHKTAGWFW